MYNIKHNLSILVWQGLSNPHVVVNDMQEYKMCTVTKENQMEMLCKQKCTLTGHWNNTPALGTLHIIQYWLPVIRVPKAYAWHKSLAIYFKWTIITEFVNELADHWWNLLCSALRCSVTQHTHWFFIEMSGDSHGAI